MTSDAQRIVVSRQEFDRLIAWLDEDDDPAEIRRLQIALGLRGKDD